jgi:hypothetical protein
MVDRPLKSWLVAARRDGSACRDSPGPASSPCIACIAQAHGPALPSVAAQCRGRRSGSSRSRGNGPQDSRNRHSGPRPRWAMAAPDLGSRACACSTPRSRACRLPCGLLPLALPPPGPMRHIWFRVTCCPCVRGCAGPRGTGKPLQIAVDGVPGTTEQRAAPRFHRKGLRYPRYAQKRRLAFSTSALCVNSGHCISFNPPIDGS